MEPKYDLRVIRTYESLTGALIQLMSEKHFKDITVNELCQRAMIRRTTFYKHFADKYQFFRFFISRMQTKFDSTSPSTADYQNTQAFYLDISRHFIDFLQEHEEFADMVVGSNVLTTVPDLLCEQIMLDIMEKMEARLKLGKSLPVSPEIASSFFTGGLNLYCQVVAYAKKANARR